MRGLRAGIHRYIREPPFSRTDLSLFRDNSAFDEANDVLDAHLRVLKKQGELKATDHFPPISRPDLEKLGEFLRSSITEPMDLPASRSFIAFLCVKSTKQLLLYLLQEQV